MATTTSNTACSLCNKNKDIYVCKVCSQQFCFDHLSEHRKNTQQQFEQLQNNLDRIQQQINDRKRDSTKHSLIKQIDEWEKDSIDKIKQHAQLCRSKFLHYLNSVFHQVEKQSSHLTQEIKKLHQENAFNEIDLNHLRRRLEKLEQQLNQTTNVQTKQQSTSFIKTIFLPPPFRIDIRWKPLATIIAGGNGRGDRVNQLNSPISISVDDRNQMIYIADYENHRIVEWRFDAKIGRIVAGGNRLDQLNYPTDVIIDRQNNDLIIADSGNKRVIRWSFQSHLPPKIIIDNIDCSRLAMHEDGILYVSDWKKHEVRRWKDGETQGTIVAGGNGQGNQLNQLNQLNFPTFVFVDDDHSLYVSDLRNHRVMKWVRDAGEGVVVAGGNGQGNQLTQLSNPRGVLVDQSGQIYVADQENHRVMRWREGEKEGTVVAGGKGKGPLRNQLNGPSGLSFDDEGNLYVADCKNDQIHQFKKDFD